MKKAILISFMVGIAVMLGSSAMAQNLQAPANLGCSIVDQSVCFDWDDVAGADKYSVDVDVEVDTDGEVMTVELSFGTSDRIDGKEMGVSDLCVPLTEFVYDIDGVLLTEPEQLYGHAYAKVKALAPGRGQGRQNNPFSNTCEFDLVEEPE